MPRQLGFDEPVPVLGAQSARCAYLRRFGEPSGWLACRIELMTHDQWRKLCQGIKATGHLPRDLRDSMPRFDDQVATPSDVPAEYEPDLKVRWAAWSQIWGTPPWQTK